MTSLVARLSSLTRTERLRGIGVLVLVLGIVGACLFYWIQTLPGSPSSLDALLPDDSQAQARQIGIMMGTFGVMMLGWGNALQRPGTQAVIIVASSVLVARSCASASPGYWTTTTTFGRTRATTVSPQPPLSFSGGFPSAGFATSSTRAVFRVPRDAASLPCASSAASPPVSRAR